MFRLAAILGAAVATVALVRPPAVAAAKPISKPDHVTSQCAARANSWACRVALRYLAALDLDRTRDACSLLEPETLEGAGGMAGCAKTLSGADGIRIRYSILDVWPSPFGRTVFFSTTAGSGTAIRQAMIITPRRLILAIAPAP